MARHPLCLTALLITTAALFTGGCTSVPPHGGDAPTAWSSHAGVDAGPLTDAYGRRRSLALPPAGIVSGGGYHASRNDVQRSVTAGYTTPTYRSARTVTVDRGPGTGWGGRLGHRHGVHDGYRTRTVRRSVTETVR